MADEGVELVAADMGGESFAAEASMEEKPLADDAPADDAPAADDAGEEATAVEGEEEAAAPEEPAEAEQEAASEGEEAESPADEAAAVLEESAALLTEQEAATAPGAEVTEPAPATEQGESVEEVAARISSLLVISGPSGVGKGTLINKLMAEHGSKFGFSVSHTTRGPRPGEEDGVHYHFVERVGTGRKKGCGLFHMKLS